jgi:hypothetical protein
MKPKHPSTRREFLGHGGAAIGTALLAPRVLAALADVRKQVPGAGERVPAEITLQQTGWNIAATRFVDPPTWSWQPLPGAVGYVVMLAGESDSTARQIRLKEPRYDMTGDWHSLKDGVVTMIVWAVDAQDRPLCAAWPNAAGGKRFYKSPGFDGIAQKPLDWAGSIERAMAYMLAPARDRIHDFEGDMPRSCWSACEDSITGQRRLTGFPALHHSSFIFAYLAYARAFPEGKLQAEAVRQAKQYGDWLLEHR